MNTGKKASKIILLLSAMGFALSIFFCPANTITVKAYSPDTEVASPYAQTIQYRYVIIGNALYKRLYNYSTGNWIGDWIYVGPAPEGIN
ncbi:MAG: hypothetical protein ACI4HQ_06885 [Acetatifactor sp.]